MQSFDAAVLGLGALGGATLRALARRGSRVLGLDRFAPPHAFGSSHGESRITRQAIGEGAHLTPLALRSQSLWREMEQETGTSLLTPTGLLVISSPERTAFTHVEDFFSTTLAAARRHQIPHEVLDTAEIRRRFPQFLVEDGEQGYFEPGAGFLRPEACVAAQLGLARRAGAEIRFGEQVVRIQPQRDHVRLDTQGNTYGTRTLILAAGAWLPDLLPPPLARRFRIVRQIQCWFEPQTDSFRPERLPAFIWELRDRSQSFYGFPDMDGHGVKIATEQYAVATTADSVVRDIEPAEIRALYESYAQPFLRGVSSSCTQASVCLYTVTPDFGFVVDRHPDDERIIIASCCSGHGFKHAPALGEAIAELALDGSSRTDLTPFSLSRFHPW